MDSRNDLLVIRELLTQVGQPPDLDVSFEMCFTYTYFQFYGKKFQQTAGPLLCSPLSLIVADNFMKFFEGLQFSSC